MKEEWTEMNGGSPETTVMIKEMEGKDVVTGEREERIKKMSEEDESDDSEEDD